MPKIKFLPLLFFLLLPQLIGLAGAYFTFPAVQTWYQTLTKPWFTPPGWLFGPAWTLLYFLMGLAAYLVWQKAPAGQRRSLFLPYGLQLAFNFAWSWLFFGQRLLGLAYAEILVLWFLIFLTWRFFRRVSSPAGWLLVPYLAWVAFASFLNLAVWQLNR